METIDGPQRLMLGPVSWPLKLGGLTIVTAPLSRWWCGQSVLRRNCKMRMAVEHAIQNSMICLSGYSSIQMTTQRPFSSFSFSPFHKVTSMQHVKCCHKPPSFSAVEKEMSNKVGKKEHHLWMKRDSTGSGQKALNLVRIVSELPNEKEAVYGALDKWTAWETEFPLIAAVKALRILRKRNQWKRVIQVSKWMLSKGQGATMGTYDTLLLAFDMDWRVDEAESLWNMILHTHTRSISKRLFSRMISLYDHHDMQDKVIEVFSDMEELGVKPDEDTVMRVARAFQTLGQEDKQKLVLKKYQCKWKYIHFKGQRVRVRTDAWDEKC